MFVVRLRSYWPSFLQHGATGSAGAAEETTSKGNQGLFLSHCQCC